MAKNDTREIATMDIETDPFKYGHTPLPFAIGLYRKDDYMQFWGDDCIEKMIDYLESIDNPLIIYMHNGGGFDFWYLQEWISNPIFFIQSRVAKCGLLGKHELRDSYKMIPVPLADYQKESIDYQLFWYPTREKHKKEILFYLQKDCEYLYQLVNDFISRYGNHLTIGSAAINQLRKLHPQKHESESFDSRFRPYYMGGRNQVFERGELSGQFKIYDVNSMYPYVMATYNHPRGSSFCYSKKIPDNRVSFARITAESNGALCLNDKGLKFPFGINEFWACSHEIHEALNLGLIRIKKVHECLYFNNAQRFDSFVNKFNSLKIECDKNNDKGGRLFAKLLLNSSYGKFGQNPRNFKDCFIADTIEEITEAGYKPEIVYGDKFIGSKPAEIQDWSFNNVAIAASITSAARAQLMRGIAKADRPVYCDTDSIICEHLDMPLHDTELGAWKTEAECNKIFIAGKKLYACFNDDKPLLIKGREKKASKGANLSAETIKAVSLGDSVVNTIDAPLLRFGQDAKFIARKISATY